MALLHGQGQFGQIQFFQFSELVRPFTKMDHCGWPVVIFYLQLTSGRSEKPYSLDRLLTCVCLFPFLSLGAYATGRLEHSVGQNVEKMSRKIGNGKSLATFFCHSAAVLILPAVLLLKLPNSSHEPAIPTDRISKCAEAFICTFIDEYSYESLSTLPNS